MAIQVELNVIGQELSYNGIAKPIPQTYWTDTLTPLLYPTWDTDKDKLISFYYFDNGTYTAKRRKYVMNFKTNTNEWKDYEMEGMLLMPLRIQSSRMNWVRCMLRQKQFLHYQ